MSNGPTHTIGDANNIISRDFDGDLIAEPWPMLTFNDRPLMSPMELMLVPAVSPQELTSAIPFPLSGGATLNAFNPLPGQRTATPVKPGVPVNPAVPFIEPASDEFLFGHLLNFFRQLPASVGAPVPGYYRLFEYVEVPPRINGSQTSPLHAGDISNRGRNERVPGKMNINTIFEEEVFQAALNNHPFSMDATNGAWISPPTQIPTLTPSVPPLTWATGTLLADGQAYTNLSSELFRRVLTSIANPDATGGAEPGAPRLFTKNDRPFRNFGVGASGVLAAVNQTSPPPPSIHSTFLRGLPGIAPGTVNPVFEDNRSPNPPPGLAAPLDDLPNDLMDYPNYRWQILQKMSNVFTTRSNVYAVWMTVGFFEVLDENPDRLGAGINAPPQLGAEINADIGQNIRHRAFFIIDRSRARGYLGPPRSSEELQDILSQVVIHSRIIE
jgi:hypothetical protein